MISLNCSFVSTSRTLVIAAALVLGSSAMPGTARAADTAESCWNQLATCKAGCDPLLDAIAFYLGQLSCRDDCNNRYIACTQKVIRSLPGTG
jgi:hypothetical protein